MRVILKILTIVFMIGLASACMTLQPLKGNLNKEEIANTIRGGDEIKIVTKTGDQHLDKFAYATEDKIIGWEKEYQLEDIERIEIKQPTVVGYTVAGVMETGKAAAEIVEVLSFITVIILIAVVIF